jgi:hypothetical protein
LRVATLSNSSREKTDQNVLEPYRAQGESRTRVYVVLSPAQVAPEMKPGAPVIGLFVSKRG